MSPQESTPTPAQRLLAQLYLDTSDGRYATSSYYALCEHLRIEPNIRTSLLKELLAAGYVKRRHEGHISLTEEGKRTAIAGLA